MRKFSKVVLLAWNIFLFPAILALISILCSVKLPFQIVAYLHIACSLLFIPQGISLILTTLCWIIPFRPWEPAPTRKEWIQLILLSLFAVLGAACAFLIAIMVSSGEMGEPIP